MAGFRTAGSLASKIETKIGELQNLGIGGSTIKAVSSRTKNLQVPLNLELRTTTSTSTIWRLTPNP